MEDEPCYSVTVSKYSDLIFLMCDSFNILESLKIIEYTQEEEPEIIGSFHDREGELVSSRSMLLSADESLLYVTTN